MGESVKDQRGSRITRGVGGPEGSLGEERWPPCPMGHIRPRHRLGTGSSGKGVRMAGCGQDCFEMTEPEVGRKKRGRMERRGTRRCDVISVGDEG